MFEFEMVWKHCHDSSPSAKTFDYLKKNFREVMNYVGNELCKSTEIIPVELCLENSVVYEVIWNDYSDSQCSSYTRMHLRIFRDDAMNQ